MACFGATIAADKVERNHRFLEEALELVQACGCSQADARQLVDYVYGRPQGDINQEVGGVMVTLAALCLANGLDMHEGGEKELARVWNKIEQIRAKQAAKPKGSALPVSPSSAAPPPPSPEQGDGGRAEAFLRWVWYDSEAKNRFVAEERLTALLTEARAAGHLAGLEEAAGIAEPWLSTGHARLHAGELTAAEMRAVKAVAGSILAAIRARKTAP